MMRIQLSREQEAACRDHAAMVVASFGGALAYIVVGNCIISVLVSRFMLGTYLREEACCGVVEVAANDLGPVALIAWLASTAGNCLDEHER